MITVYAGPSLPPEHRGEYPDIRWLPPAARGDLDRIDAPQGTTVVLVDGYMIHTHPPSPSEVYRLTQRGYTVWGCSSLGALRAAELRDHGVSGFGWVYDRVVDRTVTDDDELVAVLDPRTDTARTLFLVNIRYALDQLITTSQADHEQAEHVVSGLTSVHFAQRTDRLCRRLAAEAGLGPEVLQQLLSTDVKQLDARALLHRLTAAS